MSYHTLINANIFPNKNSHLHMINGHIAYNAQA